MIELTHQHYVYLLVDPRDWIPKYIGKGAKRKDGRPERYHEHWLEAQRGYDQSNNKKGNWLRKLAKLGFDEPIYQILFQTNDEQEAFRVEAEKIEEYLRWNELLNLTPGGRGGKIYDVHPRLGKKASPELKKKLSLAHMGKPSPRKGAVLSEETKAKVRAARAKQVMKKLTHCRRGHELAGDNLYVNPNTGDRYCNACRLFRRPKRKDGTPAAIGSWQSKKTHCPQGHEYTLDNLVKTKSGHRSCKTCLRNRARARAQGIKNGQSVMRSLSQGCGHGEG